jgi:hypothetical protein
MRSKFVHIGVIVAGAMAILAAASLAVASVNDGEHDSAERHGNDPQASAEPSSYQAAILADGTITDAEYRAAVESTVACLQAQGLNAQFRPATRAKDAPTFRILSSEPLDPAAVERCKSEYMNALGAPYALELERRHAAFSRGAAYDRLFACVNAKGYDTGEGEYESFFHPRRQAEFAATPGASAALAECYTEVDQARFPD